MGSLLSSVVSLVMLNPVIFIILAAAIGLCVLVMARTKSINTIKESYNRRTVSMRRSAYEHVQTPGFTDF